MNTFSHSKRARKALRAWVVLDVCGLVCVGGLWLVFGGGSQGLGPYFQAVGSAAISWEKLSMYTLFVSAYSVAIELVLRVIQDHLLTRTWRDEVMTRLICIGVPAILYGLTHSIYHLPGVLYALVLGVVTASVYARWRSKVGMAAWHVQWNVLAITGSMALATGMPGAPRDHMVATYKLSQIERGVVVRDPELGWIDRHHYDEKTYHRVLELARLPATDAPKLTYHVLTLHATLHTQWGTRHPLQREYEIASHQDPEMQRAIACGVTLDFQDFHERAQDEIGWWSGLSLSAYQHDDLAAAWALCLDRETGFERVWKAPSQLPTADELSREVNKVLTFEALSLLARDTNLALWRRVSLARGFWRVQS